MSVKNIPSPFFFLLFSIVLAPYGIGQNEEVKEKVTGYIDHLVVTVPGLHYDSLIAQLKTYIPKTLAALPDNSKAFIIPSETIPYVELWNSSTSVYTGSQIALGSNDPEAIEKAQAYYGYAGKAYGELITIGSEFSAGHPYGGNFFVSYGNMNLANPNDSIEVKSLNSAQTLTPDTKMSIKKDYTFYDLQLEEDQELLSVRDTKGTSIYTKFVESSPEAVLGGGIGHVSLSFELSEAMSPGRKEIKVSDDIILVFEDKVFTLILLNEQYKEFE